VCNIYSKPLLVKQLILGNIKMNEVPPALIRISEVALKQSPAQIDPISLAMILYSLMKICSKAFLRKTFLRAEKKPHGIVARIIKSKIKAN